MSDRDRIPTVQVGSGAKFVNDRGITAIKDGIKSSVNDGQRLSKPDWLRIRVRGGATFEKVQAIVHEHKLATVCEEAKCPNMSECWSSGTATIMLMGDVCTRACRFCAVNTGNPKSLYKSSFLALDIPEICRTEFFLPGGGLPHCYCFGYNVDNGF